jgi:hypothetical protein
MRLIHFIISITVLLLSETTFGQSYYSVAVEGGLFARSTPSLTAPRIGKFACGEDVILLKETNEFVQIKDRTTSIEGYWVQVKSANGLVGYLCKGYLIEKHQDLDYHNYCEEEYGACNAKISTKDYQLYLHNYQMAA